MEDDPVGTVLITYGTPEDASLAANIDRLVRVISAVRAPVRLITYCDSTLFRTLEASRIHQLPEHRIPWIKFFMGQVDLVRTLIRLGASPRAKTLFFAFGSDLSLLPILLGRLLGYQIVLRSDGRPTAVISRYFPGSSRVKLMVFKVIESAVYRCTDLLLTESVYMIDDNQFAAYGPGVAPLPVNSNWLSGVTPFSERPFDLVVAGRHSEQKGFDLLIDALPRLHRAHPGIRSLIIGDGPLRPAMQDRIREEGLDDHVVLAGWIPSDDLPGWLMNARILLHPSRFDGLPNVVLEAIATGTLVLATPVGGIPGIVIDGETGILISSCSSDAIFMAVERALEDPAIAIIADRAREEIQRIYSLESVRSQYDALFVELERRVAIG